MKIDVDTNLLIKEIERRPTLWDKTRSDYNDKLAKNECWDELTELFSPARISQKKKEKLNILLQNRWRSVKDQFSRSKRGKRKANYVHTPVLQFLLDAKGNMKFARSAKKVVPKAGRTLSTSAKSRKVSERKSKPPPAKRTRTGNSLVAPSSKIITSSETLEDQSISSEISDVSEDGSNSSGIPDVSEDRSNSSGIPDVPEELSNPPPEKRTRTDNSFVTHLSKNTNTPSASSEFLDVSEEESIQTSEKRARIGSSSSISTNTQHFLSEILHVPEEESKPPPEKRTRIDNSFVTLMSKNTNTPSASSEFLDVLEELNQPPENRTKTGNNSVTSKNTPSFLSEMLYVPEEESKPPPEKRTQNHNNLVEAKLIEFLERNMMELQDVTKNSQDEDRLFLLSLLTNLKTIRPQFQLKAKIEILTVLDKYPKIYEEADIFSQPQILEVRHSVNE